VILTVTATLEVPPADTWYGRTELRGIKAPRLAIEPAGVRELTRLRLRPESTTTAPSHTMEDDAAAQSLALAWHADDVEAEAMGDAVDTLLRAVRA